MIKFRPMLSGKAPDDLSTLNYPLAVSPKLDGFRCIVIDGVAMSRNLKPIRNEYAQELFGRHEYNGYDGELIVGDPTAKDCFNVTSSGVTSREGEPDVRLFVFDNCFHSDYWAERFASVNMNDNVIVHLHEVCHNHNELLRFEEEYLEQGYEGLMIRALNGPYKEGRSTTREGWLLKLKRFEDSEGLVIGMEEKLHNANEATINALGHTQRTSHQENLVPTGTMGALIIRDLKTNVEFNIGTGFDDATRDWWWNEYYDTNLWRVGKMNNGGIIRECMNPDTIVKYKHFAVGAKDKPRFPAYIGLRDPSDI